MVREIVHREAADENIFAGVGTLSATLYHSLCMDRRPGPFPHWRMDGCEVAGPSPDALEVVPLAWVEEPREDGTERILMAAKHSTKTILGVLYHPGVCLHREGGQQGH